MNQPIDFVIITALEEELDAVLAKLPGHKKLPPSRDSVRCYYEASLTAAFPDGRHCIYNIIVMSLMGMGRLDAATATGDAISKWHPRYVLLVGIAGGIAERGVNLGDILISDQIVDYELQKETADGPEMRWEVHRAAPRLTVAIKNLRNNYWVETIDVNRPEAGKPIRHIGPIASGDKVIAFANALEKYRSIWPKLIGVEMEAAGVATAAFQSADSPGFFMIRGVSDFADEKKGSKDVEKWRTYACNAAAAYAIGLLSSGPIVPNDSPHDSEILPVTLEQSTDIVKQSKNTPFQEPYIITITGASGSGKSTLLRYIQNEENEHFKPKMIAKYSTRYPHDDDKHEIICKRKIPSTCDLVYEQYGCRYGLSLKTLCDSISNGISPVVILNDIRAVEDVRSIYGRKVKSIFIHREQLTQNNYKKIAAIKGIVDKDELDIRFTKSQTLFRAYIENIHLFDHVIINRKFPDRSGFSELEEQVRRMIQNLKRTHRNVRNNNRRVMVLVGSPGSGKDSLIRAVDAMGAQHARIVPKHTSRKRESDDGPEMICIDCDKYDMDSCDLIYFNFGNTYGIKTSMIWEILQDNKYAVIIVSNLDAIIELDKLFNSMATLIYIHSDVDAAEFQRAEEKANKERQYIASRVLNYHSAFDLYRKNFSSFDHVLINNGNSEDLSDQLFRLFRVYEHSDFYFSQPLLTH